MPYSKYWRYIWVNASSQDYIQGIPNVRMMFGYKLHIMSQSTKWGRRTRYWRYIDKLINNTLKQNVIYRPI